jgi:photosystem II stability/assembly factor-like uncharacterized protein
VPRSSSRTSRCLAVAGLVALAGSVGLTGAAGSTVAAAPPAPAPASEPELRELLSGGDGSVAPRIEGAQDRALIDSQLAAAHAAPPGLGVKARLSAAQQAANLKVAAQAQLSGAWKSAHDEFRADDPQYGIAPLGWEELGGRTVSLATDPRDASGNTVWAGSAGGGVWRSTDGGKTWTPTFDDQPSMAIGAIAISPTTGWVYAGTGEANTNGDGLSGTGIYRTKDSGRSWQRVANNLDEASTVFHVAVSRAAGATKDTVLVATNSGLFTSTDGGDSYADALLPTDEDGTAPYTKTRFGNYVTDVRVQPGAPNVVTAAVGWRRGKAVGADGNPDSVGNGLYRSTEGGKVGTWKRMDTNLGQAPLAPGLSNDPIGRTSLAYASGEGQDHDVLWAVVQDAGVFRNETFLGPTVPLPAKPTVLAGVYASADNGATWTIKATPAQLAAAPGSVIAPLLALGSGPGVQAWYDQYVEVDPLDANRVIVGLEEVYSTVGNPYLPGLAAFKTIGRYWNSCVPVGINCEAVPTFNGKTTHADQHAAAFARTPGGVRLYVANDGGVFGQNADALGDTNNPTGGYDNQSWEFLNVGYTTTQPLYAVMSGDGTIYAGQQDNGTLKVEPGSRTAQMVLGGDGVDVAVDPEDSQIAHAETQNGAFRSTTNGGQTWSTRTTNITNPLFYTPFEMDPKDSEHLVIGGRQVAEKTDGAGAGAFAVSFDLGLNTRTGMVNQTSALDVDGASVYAGFCGVCDIITAGNNDPASFQNGLATNVQDGCDPAPGSTECWRIVPAKGLPNRYITDIEIDGKNPKTVYVTVGGYGRRWFLPSDTAPGVGEGHVFVSKDGGQTFTNLSGTGAQRLPDVPADAVLLRDGQLIVGNDVGVFTASTKGQSWSRLGTGLPNVSTFDLNLDPSGRKMVAATHGRGVWVYDFGARAATRPVTVTPATGPGSAGGSLPATGAAPLAVLGVVLLGAAWLTRRRTA